MCQLWMTTYNKSGQVGCAFRLKDHMLTSRCYIRFNSTQEDRLNAVQVGWPVGFPWSAKVTRGGAIQANLYEPCLTAERIVYTWTWLGTVECWTTHVPKAELEDPTDIDNHTYSICSDWNSVAYTRDGLYIYVTAVSFSQRGDEI